MPEPETTPPATTEAELRQRLDTIRARMAAPGPTPEELAAGDAEDRALVPRIHAARPGVPTHHILATLQTLRALRAWEAAKEPAAAEPVPGLRDQIAGVFRTVDGQLPAWTKRDAGPEAHVDAVLAVVQPVIDEAQAQARRLNDLVSRLGQTEWQQREALTRVRKLHQPIGVYAAAMHGEPPDCTTCGPNTYPCPTIAALTPPVPADQPEGGVG